MSTTSSTPNTSSYWCYRCNRFVRVFNNHHNHNHLDSMICPDCNGGFVEQIDSPRRRFPSTVSATANSTISSSPRLRRSRRNGGDRSPFNPVIVLRAPSDDIPTVNAANAAVTGGGGGGGGYELYYDDGAGSGLRPLPPSVSEFLLGSGFDRLLDQLAQLEMNGIQRHLKILTKWVDSMETTRILLPDDILEEILVRLPLKYLLRWKCVCKYWYSLIGDYDFVKKHYHFQYAMLGADKDAGPIFLDSPSKFYLLSKDGGDSVVLDMTPGFKRDIPLTLSNDSELCNLSVRCMGVTNGVIGIQWGRTGLALWNPATREFKDVPRWPNIPDNKAAQQFRGQIHGFVFDQQSNDFKILGLIDFDGDDDVRTIYEFHMYSLKSNSWKRIDKGPSRRLTVVYSETDAYLNNGVYYWRTYSRDIWGLNKGPILCFNFSTEVFKEFEPPEGSLCPSNHRTWIFNGHVRCGCKYWHIIGKYKEGLALFVTRTLENLDCSFEIWAVTKFREDDDGVPLSWELVVTVEPIHSFTWSLTVKAFRAYGDLLVMVARGDWAKDVEACLYDPFTHTFNNLGLRFSSCYKYVESLFSLSG